MAHITSGGFVESVDTILRARGVQRIDDSTIVVENRDRTVVNLAQAKGSSKSNTLIGLILLMEWMAHSLGKQLDASEEARRVAEFTELLQPYELGVGAIIKPNPATISELTWLAGQWIMGGNKSYPEYLAIIPAEQHEGARAFIIASVVIHLGGEENFDTALFEFLELLGER